MNTTIRVISLSLIASTLLISGAHAATSTEVYDLVINEGRVIDPETEFDGLRNVGIRAGRIVAISDTQLTGKQTIDARGQVVAPGFIDIHSHTPTQFAQRINVRDGITTALDTEAGALPVAAYGDNLRPTPMLNYGASVGHYAARIKVIEGRDQPYFFYRGQYASMSSAAFEQPASPEQIEQIRGLLEDGLNNGGLGIGLLLDYMRDAVGEEELRMIFETAAAFDAPVFTHVRRGLPGDPAGLDEVLEMALATGAPLFICHITHNAMGGVKQWLSKIDAARARGARVTTETLSYLAGGTSIDADVFRKRDWRRIFDIDYGDVQWVATGEWLTEETWHQYANSGDGGMVNHHYVKESWLLEALDWPDMMISTDALPSFSAQQLSNPNIGGSFSLVLGKYVREKGAMTLSDALSRMSLKQAQWLQQIAPAFARKGRLQVGADADIVVFDPDTIAAGADYGNPYAPPTGMNWVIVNGIPVVADGHLVDGPAPGVQLFANDDSGN